MATARKVVMGPCERTRSGRNAVTLADVGDGCQSVGGKLFGYFAVFNVWTEISSAYEGNFLERIAPTAFNEAFTDTSGVRCLFEHGKDPSVGNKPLGVPSVLKADRTGAYYEVDLFDAEYVCELKPAIAGRQLGASFRFSVLPGGDSWVESPGRSTYNPRGLPERTITGVRLFEFGPVCFAAYATVSAGLRGGSSVAALRADIDRLRRVGLHPARLAAPRRRLHAAALADEIARLRSAS